MEHKKQNYPAIRDIQTYTQCQDQNGRMPSVTISDFSSSTNHIDIDEITIPNDVETAAINQFQVTLEDIDRHR